MARLAVENIEKGFGVLWHEGPWASGIRLDIVQLLTGESQHVDASALKKRLVSSFLAWYRADAEQALDRAARLHQARQLPTGRGEIGLILTRYQRVVEHRDYVKNLHYDHEQVKAWSKLATDVVGNTIKVYAVLQGGPTYVVAAKIEEAIEKIQRGYSVLGDLPQLSLWAEALTLGRNQIRQFAAVALGPE
ncbi:MAG: hypothetical protein HY705_08100 [Gemmatimonadetes bacterium]|nr:hypothetical protein [Gemmatimonadota bacterium]